MSEAIFPRTISWTNWSNVNAAAFWLMVLVIMLRMIFSWDVLILESVRAETDTRSL